MAALAMRNLKIGALPANNTPDRKKAFEAQKLKLINHYFNHRGIDIPNGKNNSSSELVIDSIVHRFCENYKGHKPFDFFDDLKTEAKIIVLKATEKYIAGITKRRRGKTNGKIIETKINYKKKWDFCKFASEQIKYGLRIYLYHLNIDKSYGIVPDNDTTRKLYYILPKFKFDKPRLSRGERYSEISKKYNIDLEKIRFVDEFMTQRTDSLNAPASEDNDRELWQVIPNESSNNPESENNNSKVINKFGILKQTFLKGLQKREREILDRVKLKEEASLTELSKKFKISAERTRQIAEKTFEEFRLFIFKYKKDLELM